MKFTDSHNFPYSADQVISAFTNKDYFTTKYEALGNQDIEVLEVDDSGDTFRIKVSYSQPSDAPAMVQKFIGDMMKVVQEDTWNKSSKTGSLSIDVDGLPGKISAQMKLVDGGDSCVNDMEWDVSVKVPLIGGKIEKMMKEDILSKGAEDTKTSIGVIADL